MRNEGWTPDRKIFGAEEITCDQCGASPGEACKYWYGHGSRREKRFRFGSHAKRVQDANAATETLKALVS